MSSVFSASSLSPFLIDSDLSSNAGPANFSNLTQLNAAFASIISVAGTQIPVILTVDLSFDKPLGRGKSFEVTREIFDPSFDRGSPYYVAVKHVVRASDTDLQRRRNVNVARELRTLTEPALRGSPNILPLLGYGWDGPVYDRHPFIVVDYSDHGTLVDYLTRRGVVVTIRERRELALDIARGLQALHVNKIIHGDLKPENVLVFDVMHGDRPQLAKLADFGAALFESDGDSLPIYTGTPLYNAPERENRGKYHSTEYDTAKYYYLADMWSFGLTLWETMRKGQSYLEQTWLKHKQTRLEFLKSVADSEQDGILHRLRNSHDQLPENEAGVKSSVLNTLDLTLRDDPHRRCDITRVIQILSQGVSTIQPVSGYPITKTQPTSSTTGNPKSKKPESRSWRLSSMSWRNIVSNRNTEPNTGLALFHTPPKNLERYQEHTELAQIFGSLIIAKLPWDLQCRNFNYLMKSVSLNSDTPRKPEYYNNCLHIAFSYKVGYGIEADNESVVKYMNMSAEKNEVAKALYYRIASSISGQSVHISTRTYEDTQLVEYENGESYFKMRIILHQQKQNSPSLASRTFGNDSASVSKALCLACRMGNAKEARNLLKQCSSFVVDPSQPTPVHWLIMFNDQEARELGASLVGFQGERPGPCRGCLNICPPTTFQDSLFLEHCLRLRGSPLHWAVEARNSSLVKLLLELGADKNIVWGDPARTTAEESRHIMSPLDVAVELHLYEIVEILLDSGVEVSHTEDTVFRSSLHCISLYGIPFARQVIHGAKSREALKRTLKILADKGFDINEATSEGYTPLAMALAEPDTEEYIIDELLDAGSHTCHIGAESKSNAALIAARAIVSRRYNVANLRQVTPLVGPHINDLDEFGKCALHYAAGIAGSRQAVEVICGSKHCDVNTRSSNGAHAMFMAAIFDSIEVIPILVSMGVDIDVPTYRNQRAHTALMAAAGRKHKAMADDLLAKGANPDFAFLDSPMYRTVLEAACANPRTEQSILKYLLDKHPNLREKTLLNAADTSGRTALHKAAYEGDVEAVEALLYYGASHAPKDTMGVTPLDLVTRSLENGLRNDVLFARHHSRILDRGEQVHADFKEALVLIKNLLTVPGY
ncbi:ankyrin [Whalleya microplaca]|nr:ankyrin [Whalleya microplaca]